MSRSAFQILPYRRPPAGDAPVNDATAYRSTALRHPTQPLVVIPQTLSEITGPVYGYGAIGPMDCDLTRQHAGEPIGERIVIDGRVLDEDERPIPETLVEVWQANVDDLFSEDRARSGAAEAAISQQIMATREAVLSGLKSLE